MYSGVRQGVPFAMYIAEMLAILIKQNTNIKVFAVMVRNSEYKLFQIAADTPLLLGG